MTILAAVLSALAATLATLALSRRQQRPLRAALTALRQERDTADAARDQLQSLPPTPAPAPAPVLVDAELPGLQEGALQLKRQQAELGMQRHLTEARSVKLEWELGTLRAMLGASEQRQSALAPAQARLLDAHTEELRLFATSSVTVLRAHFRQQVANLDVRLGRTEEGLHLGVQTTERARAIAAAKRATHQALRRVLIERREQLLSRLSLLENVSD